MYVGAVYVGRVYVGAVYVGAVYVRRVYVGVLIILSGLLLIWSLCSEIGQD